MPLEFLDVSGSRQLAIFSEMMDTIATGGEDPKSVHQTLVGMMRRAFGKRCYMEVAGGGLPTGSYRITRVWREDDEEGVPNHSPWDGSGVPIRGGGIIAEILAQKRPLAVNRLRVPTNDPAFLEIGRYRSLAAAPGGSGDRCNWVIVLDLKEDAFTPDDVATLLLRVNLIGLSLKNLATLGELRRASAYIQSEVDRIADIQRSLLPEIPADASGLRVAGHWETFDRAGGDAYDCARLPDGSWAFLISDASGHGPAAAVVSAVLNAILHTLPAIYGSRTPEPGEVLAFANAQLAEKRIDQSFVTAWLGIWNPRDRTLTYARAGHNPALLRRGNGIHLLNAVGDLPLAIFSDTTYSEQTVMLKDGDIVLLFTDGIVEARNDEGEMFGDDRLQAALLAAPGGPEEILASILRNQRQFLHGTRSRDDATMLVLELVENAGADEESQLPLKTEN
jgi:sigma-B regulation protein RsbU (phosphoserine phosphatase)